MQRTRMLVLALVALGLSAVVTYLIYRELNSRMVTEEAVVNQLVIASQELGVGVPIEPQHLKIIDWPGDPLEGSYSVTDELIGRGVLFPIQKNEPLLDAKLTAPGSGAGLAATIPEGKRALSVRVDDVVGVAGFVLPGTRVDIILSGSVGGSGGIDVSKVVLENVQVLAAGQSVEYDSSGKAQKVPVVTVLLTPEEAQKLTLATIDGRIRLALRNPLDLEIAEPKPTRRSELYEGAAPPRPPRPTPIKRLVISTTPPPPPRVKTFEVELIQGDSRETLEFQSRAEAQARGQGQLNE